jgi:hypothetical protein
LGKRFDQDCKRLVLPIFDLSNPKRGLLAGCIAEELITANTFDKNNAIGSQYLLAPIEHRLDVWGARAMDLLRMAFMPYPSGPTFKATDRLCMETTIRRIGVLALAISAQGENIQSGSPTIKRRSSLDRVTRSTLRAAIHQVMISATRWIENFA